MLKAKPKYTFGVTGNRCRKVESGEVEIGMEYLIPTFDENGEPLKNSKFTVRFLNGNSIAAQSDDKGIIQIENETPSEVSSVEHRYRTGEIGEL